MKRCPECRRDYYDDSLLYCLDDGSALLEGPRSELPASAGGQFDEPQTAILHETASPGEAATRTQIHATELTAILPSAAEAEPRKSLDKPSEKQGISASKAVKPLIVAAIAVVAIVGGFFGYRYFSNFNSKKIESIAVMPFVNESGNADLEYLSDGMTESLISSLSQVAGLSVKGRSSVFRYKGKDTDAKTIGKELGVQAILNGRLVQRGDQLTLTLELIDAQNENVLWSDTYDRLQADLVSLQTEIARDVSSKLKIKLTSADQLKLAKRYTNDPEVYRLYLQGRYYWNKRTPAEVAKGVPFFQQAVEKDPNFALGLVGLADSNEDNDRPRKKEYIRRALEIDDNLAEAHASLGYQYMVDFNWPESERELKRAIDLNPNYPQAYQWNSMRLIMTGKYDEARSSLVKALELDPTSTGINFYYGVLMFASGKTDDSIRQLKKLAEMEPSLPWTHTWLSNCYSQQGNHAASVEERALALEIDDRPDDARRVRESFAKGGWNGYLLEMIHQLDLHPVSSRTLRVKFLAQLGRKEEALAELAKANDEGDFWLFTIKFDRTLDSLRDDPQFQAIVKKFDPPE
ncbi:MAG TPA: hypothetical protein PLR83_01455 [Pyrinomonadaceae bacterium]|nr:hypothetical protein [Pyrinomonadaceae bacterium]